MRRQLLSTAFIAASIALGGVAFAQSQNSTDAGKRTDPDAASDVREGASMPAIAPSGRAASGQAGTIDQGQAGVAPDNRHRQQAIAPVQGQNSTDAGKRNDPDADSDAKEGQPAH